MTGKEALEYIKVNTRYRYVGWHVNHIEEVRKDLEELDKYKRAFEILKDTLTLSNRDEEYYLMGDFYDKITKEEYELLEELMNNASNNN